MTVMHHFNDVAKGENYSVAGRDAAKGTDKALAMDLGDGTATDADKNASTSNANYAPGLLVEAKGEACQDYTSSATASARGIDMPESCFRIIGTPDYLSGYSIEVAAKGSAVAWGSVKWEDDPFEDLTCESVTFMASEQVDICALFEDEVDYALDKGEEWVPSVSFRSYQTGTGIVTGEDTSTPPNEAINVARTDTDQWRPSQWIGQAQEGCVGPAVHDAVVRRQPGRQTPGEGNIRLQVRRRGSERPLQPEQEREQPDEYLDVFAGRRRRLGRGRPREG